MEEGLSSAPPDRLGFSHDADAIPDTDEDGNVQYPQATLEIENGLHQLETLLESTIDKAFDRFEIYVLRNILVIPEDLIGYIRLAHYENLPLDVGGQGDDRPTQESIAEQRQKLRETRKFQRALRQEVSRNDSMISQLKAILEPPPLPRTETGSTTETTGGQDMTISRPTGSDIPNLSFLLTDPAAKRLKVGESNPNSQDLPISTNTRFILSQLPALQKTLAHLNRKLSTLEQKQKSNQRMAGSAFAKIEERRDYIDTRTQIHLHRHGEVPSTWLDASVSASAAAGQQSNSDVVDMLKTALSVLPGDSDHETTH